MNTPLLIQVESLVEAVEAIVGLIARSRKEEDTETVEKLTRVWMDMGDSLRVSYQGNRSLSPAHPWSSQHQIGTGQGERHSDPILNGCPLEFSSEEGWNDKANCVPLAVRRRIRFLVRSMQRCR